MNYQVIGQDKEAVKAVDAAIKDRMQTWTTAEVQKDFNIIAFQAPFVVVERKADNVKGTLEFKHSPRLYFDFKKA